MVLPLLSGRFESVWTWRYVTIRRLTNLSVCSTCGKPAPLALASTALDESPRFSERFGLLDPAPVPPRALVNCSSGISNLGNFCLLAHVVDFAPGWSDSLSLRFRLGGLDLDCVFDSLVHLGPFLSGRMLLCVVILKILGGCFRSTGFTVGWTRAYATCSLVRCCVLP